MDRQRHRVHHFTGPPHELQKSTDLIGREWEFRPEKDGLIFREDPVIEGQRYLLRKNEINNPTGNAIGAKKRGYQNVGIQHNPQCLAPATALRPERRAFLMIPSMASSLSLSRP